ncbi:MAG: ATP-dependent helicase [Desulfamplus sp.]|nr:ATP-dependent helicase [Desulfamplus sp.]
MMKIDTSQKKFCKSDAKNIRLLAPAGSGKTLSLLWRCRYLYEKKSEKSCKFLIFTFTRVARDELRDRLANDPDFTNISRGVVRVETLNQWGYNYLKKNIESSLEVKASQKDSFFLIKNMLRPIWVNHPIVEKALSKEQKKYVKVMDIINSFKNSGFRHNGDDIYSHFENHVSWLKENGCGRYFDATIYVPLYELQLLDLTQDNFVEQFKPFLDFWKDATTHLWNSAVISLNDQKYWALIKLQEKYNETTFPEPNRYQHIMVDEFQDINPLDLFLIKQLQKVNKSSLIIVGDDDQAIFEWRGSTPNFIITPDKFFGTKFQSHKLSINYRSPINIVEKSQKLIAFNKNRVEKIVKAKLNSNAEIIFKIFPTHMDSIQYITDLAKQANKSGEPKQLAVIGRKKSQIIPLQIVLTSENIPFYAKEDLNVLLSNTFEELKEILITIATKSERKYSNDIVKSFLRCCNQVKTYPLKSLESKQLFNYLINNNPKTFMDALKSFEIYNGSIKGFTDESMKLDFYQAIKNVISCDNVAKAIEEIGNNFKGLQKNYAKSEDDIFYKDPPFLYLAEYASRYGNNFLDFIEHIENAIRTMNNNNELDDDSIDSDLKTSVHLMTALRAKGKEFNTVVLLDVNDGIWPSKLAETDLELEQERRIFYVAVTRPRKKLIISAVQHILNKNVCLSPYLREMEIV